MSFEKLMAAYAQRKGVDTKSLRFMFDGKRIDGSETPKMVRKSHILKCEETVQFIQRLRVASIISKE